MKINTCFAWKTPLFPVIESAWEDIEVTRRLVTDLINQKIDIPGIREDVELMMFDGCTRFVTASVVWFLGKKGGLRISLLIECKGNHRKCSKSI